MPVRIRPELAYCMQAKAEELKGPKKLSEFKVNPSIAATLGQLPGGALQPPQAKAASNGTIPAVHAQATAPADLLLELDAPAAAAPALSGETGCSAPPCKCLWPAAVEQKAGRHLDMSFCSCGLLAARELVKQGSGMW